MIGYDIDGVLTAGIHPEGSDWCVISGRTWSEYDHIVRALAEQAPVYIRGDGVRFDRVHAGRFKAAMVGMLGVSEFHEDDPVQAKMIEAANPDVTVVLHAQPQMIGGLVL